MDEVAQGGVAGPEDFESNVKAVMGKASQVLKNGLVGFDQGTLDKLST